ncbi:hypothetical protein [Nitrosophilus alvini]|uniref:hypothetical protein n=1 Tax=Nitrosophilus alvini TaxID=2714855 RepID=UPI00190B8D38|nr:hypothetical protein [Nitrosophilus alvini]
MNKLKDALKKYDKNELCKKLNYQNLKKCNKRISILFESSIQEFLNGSSYDFLYSNEEFLNKICEILEIDLSDEIKIAKDRINRLKTVFPAYIKVKHHYKPSSWSGAMVLGKFTIKVDKERIVDKELHEQTEYVQKIIKKWIKNYELEIPYFGFIYRYDKEKYIEFDKNGNPL